MDDKNKKPSQEELLKAVADVLDEALAEYEQLSKGMGMQELPQQPQGFENAEVVADPAKPAVAAAAPAPEAAPAPAQEAPVAPVSAEPVVKEEPRPEEKPEDDKDKKKKDGEEDEDEKESDEKLMETYKSVSAKLESKGLLKKTEQSKPETEAPKQDEEFRKSVESRLEAFKATIGEVSETVKRLAARPMPRRGVVAGSPLVKAEGQGQSLSKGEVINKLLDLRKGGDRRIDTALINRVETNRLSNSDVERIKTLGILG